MSAILKILLMAVFIISAPGLVFAEKGASRKEIVGKEKALEDVKRRLREEQREVRAIVEKETSILEELEGINKSISGKRAEIRKIEVSLDRIGDKIREAGDNISRLEQERAALSKRLSARLRAMYMMRKGEAMDVIFSSASSVDLARRHKSLAVVMDYDSGLISGYEKNLKALEESKQELNGLQADLARDRKEALVKKNEAEGLQKRKYEVLKHVKLEKGKKEKVVTELEQAAKGLSDLIGRLRKDEETSDAGFAMMKGRLEKPVKGKVVSGYGRVTHPRFQTVTFNNGIVIEAPVGTPVKNVYDGRVAYVGWLKGYGQVMIIDHSGGFYTLFAYLSDVLKEKGDKVEKGTEVALVGDTGPQASGGLYFEIRQKGVPRDPMAWLSSR